MTLFRYEYERLKTITLPLIGITCGLQLLFLYFFGLVGRYDPGERDGLLSGYRAVLGLATTGTMCAVAIYGSVLASRLLVRDYVGMNKSKTFSLPIGRRQLFLTRLLTFSLLLAGAVLVGLVVANLIFCVTGLWLPLTVDQPLGHLLALVIATVVCLCLSLAIILSASFIGIYFNSITKPIVSSIILVVLLSNLSALMLISFAPVSLILSFTLLVGIVIASLGMSRRIEKSEAP